MAYTPEHTWNAAEKDEQALTSRVRQQCQTLGILHSETLAALALIMLETAVKREASTRRDHEAAVQELNRVRQMLFDRENGAVVAATNELLKQRAEVKF